MTDRTTQLPTLHDLPATEVVWSNSMLSSMRSCEQKFVFQYADGLDYEGTDAMKKGSWFHFCVAMQGWAKGHKEDTLLHRPDSFDPRIGKLNIRFNWNEGWFQNIGSGDVVFDEDGNDVEPTVYPISVSGAIDCLINEVWAYQPEEYRTEQEEAGTDLPTLTRDLVTRYLYNYRRVNKREKVLLVEFAWRREHEGYTFGGTVDRVVVDQDDIVVVRDHKTHQNMPSALFRLTNSQLHWYGWGITPYLTELGYAPMAVEFDYAVTRKPVSIDWTKPTKASKFSMRLYAKLATSESVDEYTLKTGIKEMEESIEAGTQDVEVKYTKAERDEAGIEDKDATYTVRPTIDYNSVTPVLTKVEEKDNPFFNRKMMPLNSAVIQTILEESVELLTSVYPRMLEGRAVRNVGWFSCDKCAFAEVCMGNLYGNDTDLLLDAFSETKIATVGGNDTEDDAEEITA